MDPSHEAMGGHTQDEWSRYWLEWRLEAAQIPQHEEEIKLFLVYLFDRIKRLEYQIRDLERPWWQRWWLGR